MNTFWLAWSDNASLIVGSGVRNYWWNGGMAQLGQQGVLMSTKADAERCTHEVMCLEYIRVNNWIYKVANRKHSRQVAMAILLLSLLAFRPEKISLVIHLVHVSPSAVYNRQHLQGYVMSSYQQSRLHLDADFVPR